MEGKDASGPGLQQQEVKHGEEAGEGQATIICECDGNGMQVDGNVNSMSGQPVVSLPVLQDQNLENPTEIRIKVDVDDPASVEDQLAQLGHTNVTTASIITIPVVPYTVIGETDGVSGEMGNC